MQDNPLRDKSPSTGLGSTHLDSGVLEQGPAAIEAKQALADNCGVEKAVAAQNGGICVALQGPRHWIEMQAQAGCMALCIPDWAEKCTGCPEIMRLYNCAHGSCLRTP